MLTFKNKLKTLSVEQLEQLTEHLNKIEDNLIAVLDLVDVEIISDHVGYSFSMVHDTITDLMYDSNCALSDMTEGRPLGGLTKINRHSLQEGKGDN